VKESEKRQRAAGDGKGDEKRRVKRVRERQGMGRGG
jgi:hypothetical protein